MNDLEHQNHPFVDGNKRTALHAAFVFLGINGFRVDMAADALYDLVIAVTAGEADKTAIAAAFRAHAAELE